MYLGVEQEESYYIGLANEYNKNFKAIELFAKLGQSLKNGPRCLNTCFWADGWPGSCHIAL